MEHIYNSPRNTAAIAILEALTARLAVRIEESKKTLDTLRATC